MSKSEAEIKAENQAIFDLLNGQTSTITNEVVVEKSVIKEVEKDCPECPPVPDCPPAQVVDKLVIRGGGDILVKGKNKNKTKKSVIVDGWIFGDECEVETPQETVSGRFAVTSLDNLHPSHIPPEFSPNPKNPYNERDYQKNKSEQGKVIKNANRFKPKFLINDDNTAVNGALIVNSDGVVLGGNGRAMSLMVVVREMPDKYDKYYAMLLERSDCFGINAEDIKSVAFPVLVRVVETNKKKTIAHYSRIFNENLMLKMDVMDMAISIINALGEERVKQIADKISSYLSGKELSLRQVMGAKNVLPDFVNILERKSIINDINRDTFMDADGLMKDEAGQVIEYMFYAMVFANRRVIDYIIENDFIKIEQVFGLLLELKNLSGIFNILPQFSSAVLKMKAGRNSAQQKLTADEIYRQDVMFAEYRTARIEYLCMKLLEMKDGKKQKDVLQNYLKLSRALTSGFYSDPNASPEDLLNKAFDDNGVAVILANLGDGVKKSKKDFPCTIRFSKEEVVLGGKNYALIKCKIGSWEGHSATPKSQYNSAFDTALFSVALEKCLTDNGLFSAKDFSTTHSMYGDNLATILEAIDRKYDTLFRVADFEEVGSLVLLRSSSCGNVNRKELTNSYYMPAMFDGNKKTSKTFLQKYKSEIALGCLALAGVGVCYLNNKR